MYHIVVQLKSYSYNVRSIIHKFTSIQEKGRENERAQYIIYVNMRTNLRSYIHVYTFISRSILPIFIYADINNEITTVIPRIAPVVRPLQTWRRKIQKTREREKERNIHTHAHMHAHTEKERAGSAFST